MIFMLHLELKADDLQESWIPEKAIQAKHWLDNKGIAGSLSLVNDWSRTFSEGSAQEGALDRYSLDVSVTVDTKRAFGWSGGTSFLRLKNHIGENGGDYVGDAQGFSNIDDASRTRLYEAWFEQKVGERDRLRLKAGKVDANAEFAVVQVAADFLNSSMGYSPTILALPTYPEPKLGVAAFVSPKQHYLVSGGLFRTAKAGKMAIFEGATDWQLGKRELGGRSSFGIWHLRGPLTCFDGDTLSGTHGFYVVTEQALWSRNRQEPSHAQQLSAFVQYGYANGEVSRFTRHTGGGIVLKGPFAARADDSVGAAVTSVHLSDELEAGFEEHGEVALELYYKIRVKRFLSLTPDFQFIHHPGGAHSPANALVVTPRINLNF